MDQDFIDALLATRPRLTAGELSVALARASGHVTPFDIKRITGIDVDRIRAYEEGIATKCGNVVLRTTCINTSNRKVTSPQSVVPPYRLILGHLLASLGRSAIPHRADIQGFRRAYGLAYERVGRNHQAALDLITDAIDYKLENFKRSTHPGSYLPRIVDTYFAETPPKSRDQREWEVFAKKRLRWNPNERKWEAM